MIDSEQQSKRHKRLWEYIIKRISASTVRRRLRERGIGIHKAYRGNVLMPVRRINRYNWCRQHLRWTQRQWQGVLFTDESRFCIDLNNGRAKVWRRPGERYADCCVRESSRWGGGSVMVLGGIIRILYGVLF